MARTKKEKQRLRRQSLRPHPTRDAVLDVMRAQGEPISPMAVSELLGSTLGSIAYHMRTLREAGVIDIVREGRVRGAVEHFYGLVEEDDDYPMVDSAPTVLALCNLTVLVPPGESTPALVPVDDELRAELRAIVEKIQPSVRAAAKRAISRRQLAQHPAADPEERAA